MDRAGVGCILLACGATGRGLVKQIPPAEKAKMTVETRTKLYQLVTTSVMAIHYLRLRKEGGGMSVAAQRLSVSVVHLMK